MPILIRTHLIYATQQPCDLLLQIEATPDPTQLCQEADLSLTPQSPNTPLRGDEDVGMRRWIKAAQQFECHYRAVYDVQRAPPHWAQLAQTPWAAIPSDVVKYLMPSRYCHSDQFFDFVSNQFPALEGGPLVLAMADWIAQNFTYDNGVSHAGTTASDSFMALKGVCRDYVHVLIAFARAAGLPARFVSVYAPDVTPKDFHAVAEVYLEGHWHLIDPTGMAQPQDMVKICVGRDAADASFLTSYGWMDLVEQSVRVDRMLP